MTVIEAKALLDACERFELYDGCFGDREVVWRTPVTYPWFDYDADPEGGEVVAQGYFGKDSYIDFEESKVTFRGADAQTLRKCGRLMATERNDGGED